MLESLHWKYLWIMRFEGREQNIGGIKNAVCYGTQCPAFRILVVKLHSHSNMTWQPVNWDHWRHHDLLLPVSASSRPSLTSVCRTQLISLGVISASFVLRLYQVIQALSLRSAANARLSVSLLLRWHSSTVLDWSPRVSLSPSVWRDGVWHASTRNSSP